MQLDDFFNERNFGFHDIFDRLTGHGLRREPDQVTRMTCGHGDAQFAVCLETANARPMTCPRINHHKWPHVVVNLDAHRRFDAHQPVIDRSRQVSTTHNELIIIAQNVRFRLGRLFVELVATFPHDVPKKDRPLHCVDQVILQCVICHSPTLSRFARQKSRTLRPMRQTPRKAVVRCRAVQTLVCAIENWARPSLALFNRGTFHGTLGLAQPEASKTTFRENGSFS